MSSILKIFANPTLGEVLSLLVLNPDKEFYQSNLAQKTKKALIQVQRALKTLKEIGLITTTREGRMVYYQAITTHPAFEALKNLFLKTLALGENFRKALDPFQNKVRFAFVFGSFARGEESADSDIDLLIVGNLSLRELSKITAPLTRELDREVNPVIFTPREFQKKILKNDHFLLEVISSPKLWIIGNDSEFNQMAKGRKTKVS